MKEIKRKGKYGCSITIRFAEQPNIQAEDTIMRILVDSFENRIAVLQIIDKVNISVV